MLILELHKEKISIFNWSVFSLWETSVTPKASLFMNSPFQPALVRYFFAWNLPFLWVTLKLWPARKTVNPIFQDFVAQSVIKTFHDCFGAAFKSWSEVHLHKPIEYAEFNTIIRSNVEVECMKSLRFSGSMHKELRLVLGALFFACVTCLTHERKKAAH